MSVIKMRIKLIIAIADEQPLIVTSESTEDEFSANPSFGGKLDLIETRIKQASATAIRALRARDAAGVK